MKQIAWAIVGVVIALSLAIPWHFYNEGYRLLIVTPREAGRWTNELIAEVEDKYPGGSFAREAYWRCEKRIFDNGTTNNYWVAFRANHDVEVTRGMCW